MERQKEALQNRIRKGKDGEEGRKMEGVSTVVLIDSLLPISQD